MIPLILLHIALAQVVTQMPDTHGTHSIDHEPNIKCHDNGVWLWTGTRYGWVCNNDPSFDFNNLHPVGKPAEHVIEIRTKRSHKPCPAPITHLGNDLPPCERVTKTLWIDGQKVGIIKETEEK